jgi:predicted dienelactone hydrolase
MHLTRSVCSILVLLSLLPTSVRAAERAVAAPVVPPYAADRKPLATDFIRFDWHDAARNRDVPVKIYHPINPTGPLPIILFSHGLGGTREAYEYLGRQWAASGYVVIHLQHIGTDDSAWRGQDRPMQSMRRAISAQSAIDRTSDVKFTLDQLEQLNRDDAKLKGKLDLKHIGIAGHSFGAHTAIAIAGQGPGSATTVPGKALPTMRDQRVTAAIAMSPNVPVMRNRLDEVMAGVTIPVFYMTGTKDDSPIGDTPAADRRIPFDHTKHSPAAYLLTFEGGDHMVFSGRLAPRPGDEEFQRQIRLASTAFWDAYLKHDAAAKKWLNSGLGSELGALGTFESK